MSPLRLLILGVGFVAAILSAVLAVNLTSTTPETIKEIVEVPSIETIEVLVATKGFNRGDVIDEGSLTWRPWPTDSVTERHILRSERAEADQEFAGNLARTVIFEAQPVHEGNFVQAGIGFMAAVLSEGKRAVSTAISPGTGAGGFILPDDRVDVLMTRSIGQEGPNEVFDTEIVLRNVRVLAIDQVIQEGEDSSVVVGETATLELDEKQVEVLTIAQQLGDRITLALRSIKDHSERVEVDVDHIVGGGAKNVVTIVRNGQRSTVRTNR